MLTLAERYGALAVICFVLSYVAVFLVGFSLGAWGGSHSVSEITDRKER